MVVVWRFRFRFDEARAEMAGVLLPVLSGFIVMTPALNLIGYREAVRSLIGIGILLAAAFAMPLLASQKGRLAAVTSSASLKADALKVGTLQHLLWLRMSVEAMEECDG
jgi:divalent metal cation (Fe/Co/Zn/Cd) transporter